MDMQFFSEFMVMAISALTIENAVFTRALGINRTLLSAQRQKNLLIYGGILTLITTLASGICWWVTELLAGWEVPGMFRSVSFLVCISVLYLLFRGFCKLFLPRQAMQYFSGVFALAVFNCAVLGSVLLSALQAFTLSQFMGFGFGTGVGFTAAAFLLMEGRKRIELSRVPKAFQGLPATMIYIGLLSLTFFGLSGHLLLA